jgi:hypothetical protein
MPAGVTRHSGQKIARWGVAPVQAGGRSGAGPGHEARWPEDSPKMGGGLAADNEPWMGTVRTCG